MQGGVVLVVSSIMLIHTQTLRRIIVSTRVVTQRSQRREARQSLGKVGVRVGKVIEVKVICTSLICIGILQIVVQDEVLDTLLFCTLSFLLRLHSNREMGIRGHLYCPCL